MPCNSTFYHLSNPSWNYVFGAINVFIAPTASISNALVLFLIFWYTTLHTLSNKILASLAVSDFFVGLILSPMHAAQLLNENMDHNCSLDQVRRYLSVLLIGSSAFTIGAVSYDRYLHMTKLQNYNLHMTQRKMSIILAISWLTPAIIPIFRKIDESEALYSAIIVVYVCLMLGILAFCYVFTLIALKGKSRWRTSEPQTAHRQVRATKTVIILLTCHVAASLPIMTYHIIHVTDTNHRVSQETRSGLYVCGQTVAMFNSSINPLIYYLRNPTMRRCLLKLLKRDFYQAHEAGSQRGNGKRESTLSYENRISQTPSASCIGNTDIETPRL